jgi:Ca-activated chloride channel family protein
MSSRDAWIDDDLRNVVLPSDLLTKLNAIAALDDAELDRALVDVPVSASLLDRLRSIGSLDEVDVEDELRHVPAPVALAEKLKGIPAALGRIGTAKAAFRWLSIAASLFVAATIGYLAAISPWLFGHRDGTMRESSPAVAQRRPAVSTPIDQKAEPIATGPQLAAGKRPQASRIDEPPASPPEVTPSVESSSAVAANPVSPPVPSNQRSNVTASDAFASGTPLGAGVSNDPLPRLESLPAPVWRGLTPPRDRGYDLMFQLKHGVHPFVSPAASPALVASSVPVVTSTDSFDEIADLVAHRSLPPAHKVRTEEFLAAMDYGFARPEHDALGIRTALGPSAFGMPGSAMLQVAAQAKDLTDQHQPAHLILIIDTSASMLWEGRWNRVRQGIHGYIEHMGPDDRLSLVAVGEKASVLTTAQSKVEALKSLELLPAQPSARAVNVVDGLDMAGEVVTRAGSGLPTGIALLTDGMLQLAEPMNERFESAVQKATGNGQRFEVLDVRQEETIDDELARLASAADGKAKSSGQVMHAKTAADLRWHLAGIADDRSQLIASRAAIKVTFKPESVAMYRLLGHEATSVAGLISTSIEADLRAGEAATGLFELILRPDGDETIANVEVSWHDPRSGRKHTSRQTVSRLQLAPTFHQSAMSLQLAALSAQTAEILRNSPFAPPHSHSLAAVAQLGSQLSPRLRDSASFKKLMALVDDAQRSTAATP